MDEEKKARLAAFAVDLAEAGPQTVTQATAGRKRRKQPPPPPPAPASEAGLSAAPSRRSSRAASQQGSNRGSQPGVPTPDAMIAPGLGSVEEPDAIQAAMAHDIPMQKVCLYLQTVPESLTNLSPAQAMQGVKLGNQVFAAQSSVSSLPQTAMLNLHTRPAEPVCPTEPVFVARF